MRRIPLAIVAVITFGTLSLSPRLAANGAQQPAGSQQVVSDISPEAFAQIGALLQEKASRTPAQKKMDSQLVYAVKMARREPIAAGVTQLEVRLARDGTDASTDVAVPADFDGDGKVDPAVFRPSTGGWYVLKSSTNYTTSVSVSWGLSTDVPILKRPWP